jgi:hypothetical protein
MQKAVTIGVGVNFGTLRVGDMGSRALPEYTTMAMGAQKLTRSASSSA